MCGFLGLLLMVGISTLRSKLEKGKLGPQYFQLTRVEPPLPYEWGQSGGRGDPTFYSHLPGI